MSVYGISCVHHAIDTMRHPNPRPEPQIIHPYVRCSRNTAVFRVQACVTMTKCDVALSADAAAVTSAHDVSLGHPAIDCIIHAGGVLKVSAISFGLTLYNLLSG